MAMRQRWHSRCFHSADRIVTAQKNRLLEGRSSVSVRSRSEEESGFCDTDQKAKTVLKQHEVCFHDVASKVARIAGALMLDAPVEVTKE